MDAFTTTYPNCTQLQGDLYLGSYSNSNNSNISNLAGLSGITSIAGRLQMDQVTQLVDFSDLTNLTSMDSMWLIQSNLQSINGLQNIITLNNIRLVDNNTQDYSALNHLTSLNQLNIFGDNVLTDLSGFDHFTNITFLDISSNQALTSINAFQNINVAPSGGGSLIKIRNNQVLSTLNAFQSSPIISTLEIEGNPSLTNLNAFQNVQTVHSLRIYDNGLTSLNNVFTNLTTINSLLTIGLNSNLTALDDFNALTSVQGVSILHNNSLQNINGFNNLPDMRSLAILSNLALTQVNAFQNIRPFDYLSISGHPLLTDLNFIANADLSLLNQLIIVDNDLISTCNVTSICQYLNSNNADADIRDNAPGCNTPLEVATGCNLNVISGSVYYDLNSNSTYDAGDVPIHNKKITSTNATDTFTTYTRANGSYDNFTDDGSLTTAIDPITNFTFATASHSTVFSGVGNQDANKDFVGSVSNIIDDVSISVIPTNAARPGFEARYRIILKNLGTQVSSGTLDLTYDTTKLTFNSTGTSPSSQTTGTINYNYANLNLFETRVIQVSFNVALPPVLIGGEILDFTAQINPTLTDLDISNNTNLLSQTVMNSYDPNDKTVFEGEEILPNQLGEYLHYFIRFQNTGTASAINIKVTDTLSTNLDWDTFEPLDMSHDVGEIHIKNKQFIDFDFPNINLPDSTANEPMSHGYIYYRIKPKQNLVVGDQMENTAYIFFDFNEAIITNTTTTTVVQTLSTTKEELFELSLYPNPASSILHLQTENVIDLITLINIQGQELISTPSKDIDVSSLKSGIYFVRVQSGNAIEVLRFVKM